MCSSTQTERAYAAECSERTSALAAVYRQGRHHCDAGQSPGICLRERSELQLINLRGNPEHSEFASAITRILECTLPTIPNTSTCGARCSALWLGPREWLLVGATDTVLTEALQTTNASFTDISHGRTIIRVNGSAVRSLLAKGCALDLHPRSFQSGNCAQTAIAQVNVLLHQIDQSTFDFYVARSYAQYFWEWLTEGAAEFGCEVVAPTT